MNKNFLALKNETLDLNELAFEKIRTYGKLSFREVTKILGVNYHLSRKQTFQLLKTWKRKGWIKILPYHGIEILR